MAKNETSHKLTVNSPTLSNNSLDRSGGGGFVKWRDRFDVVSVAPPGQLDRYAAFPTDEVSGR